MVSRHLGNANIVLNVAESFNKMRTEKMITGFNNYQLIATPINKYSSIISI